MMMMIMTINKQLHKKLHQPVQPYLCSMLCCVMKVEVQNHLSPSRAWPAGHISPLQCDPNCH